MTNSTALSAVAIQLWGGRGIVSVTDEGGEGWMEILVSKLEVVILGAKCNSGTDMKMFSCM